MHSEEAVRAWTSMIVLPSASVIEEPLMSLQMQYGFCYVEGCPITPSATQALLERIAFIRHTHYGNLQYVTALRPRELIFP